MLCEVCGEKRAASRIDMEGLHLSVCEGCAKFGNAVVRQAPAAQRVIDDDVDDLVADYAERVQGAMAHMGLTVKELAARLMEKSGVIERVEKGRMLPDPKLVRKLEKFLGISLRSVADPVPQGKRSKEPVTTLGDIAEVQVKAEKAHR